MDQIPALLKLFTEFGTAALFIGLYLYTVRYYRDELTSSRDKTIAMTERLIKALEDSSRYNASLGDAISKMSNTIDASQRTIQELLAFMRGKESR